MNKTWSSRLEALLEWGGTRKDIVLLALGGTCLALSLANSRLGFLPLPFGPSHTG